MAASVLSAIGRRLMQEIMGRSVKMRSREGQDYSLDPELIEDQREIRQREIRRLLRSTDDPMRTLKSVPYGVLASSNTTGLSRRT